MDHQWRAATDTDAGRLCRFWSQDSLAWQCGAIVRQYGDRWRVRRSEFGSVRVVERCEVQEAADDLLREVLGCGVEYESADFVIVQIPKALMAAIRERVKGGVE